jgi:low temperature requirement protein LtrA
VGRAGVASRFEATLLHVGRWQAHWMLLAVMLAGLFMNAAIAMPSTPEGAFLIPLLGIQAGRSILMMVAASTRMLRGHYARLLCWILVTAPLWLAGTTAEAASRLRWWAGAAVMDLAGTWLAHPLPGRVLRSEHVEFDAGRLLDRYIRTTTDPILAARRTVNGLLVSVAGLIAVAVGNELVITHPHGQASAALSLLLFGGPLLYLLSQTSYLWVVLGIRSWPRVAGIAALVVAGACPTCSLPMERWGWWPPCCSRSSSSSSASRI